MQSSFMQTNELFGDTCAIAQTSDFGRPNKKYWYEGNDSFALNHST